MLTRMRPRLNTLTYLQSARWSCGVEWALANGKWITSVADEEYRAHEATRNSGSSQQPSEFSIQRLNWLIHREWEDLILYQEHTWSMARAMEAAASSARRACLGHDGGPTCSSYFVYCKIRVLAQVVLRINSGLTGWQIDTTYQTHQPVYFLQTHAVL